MKDPCLNSRIPNESRTHLLLNTQLPHLPSRVEGCFFFSDNKSKESFLCFTSDSHLYVLILQGQKATWYDEKVAISSCCLEVLQDKNPAGIKSLDI